LAAPNPSAYERSKKTDHTLTSMKKHEYKKDKQPSFNDEAYVLDAFERFFIFEFYIRYLKSHQGQDLIKIQKLEKLITKRFTELDIILVLSKYDLVFDDDPENTYKTDINMYELVNWTLDSIQNSYIRAPRKTRHHGIILPSLISVSKQPQP